MRLHASIRVLVGGAVLGTALVVARAQEPAPAPVAPPAEDAKVAAAKVQAKEIQGQLESISPRKFKEDVGVAYQSDADFRDFIRRTLEEEMPPAKIEAATDSLIAVGLLPEGTDFAALLIDTMGSQALAYYDPKKDTFFIVKDLAPAMLGSVMLHELEHAIQDQVFALDERQQALRGKDESDRMEALRCLWEGEATFIMSIPQIKAMGQPAGMLGTLMRPQVKATVETPFAQLLKMQEMQLRMSGATDIEAQMAATRKVPPFLLRGLQLAYIGGCVMVAEVWKAKGWAGVDALWQAPPTTTEQVLHPEKLLAETREEAVVVTVPDLAPALGDGSTCRLTDTMGEAALWILLADQLPDEARGTAKAAAAGWGGDRYAVWKKDGGRPVLAWLTVWDTPEDATQFAEAYGKAATPRNVERKWPAPAIQGEAKAVAVVEGVEDPAVAAKVVAALLAAAPK